MIEKDELKQIVMDSFNFRLNHLYNSLNNAKTKGDLHFKQKAIDKLEKIRDGVWKDIENKYDEKINEMIEDMTGEQDGTINKR